MGGAGCNALDYLDSQHLEGVELIAIDTDERALAKRGEQEITPGRDGLAAGGDADVGRRVRRLIRGKRLSVLGKAPGLVPIVAGLGGGTGSGAVL